MVCISMPGVEAGNQSGWVFCSCLGRLGGAAGRAGWLGRQLTSTLAHTVYVCNYLQVPTDVVEKSKHWRQPFGFGPFHGITQANSKPHRARLPQRRSSTTGRESRRNCQQKLQGKPAGQSRSTVPLMYVQNTSILRIRPSTAPAPSPAQGLGRDRAPGLVSMSHTHAGLFTYH